MRAPSLNGVDNARAAQNQYVFPAGKPGGKIAFLPEVGKLSGKDNLIREYLEKKIPQTVIARLLNVNRLTVRNYIITRKLGKTT